jgi:hypothetical protein
MMREDDVKKMERELQDTVNGVFGVDEYGVEEVQVELLDRRMYESYPFRAILYYYHIKTDEEFEKWFDMILINALTANQRLDEAVKLKWSREKDKKEAKEKGS